MIKIFAALCSASSFSSSSSVAFQVMVGSFTLLMVLDGKPLPEFGGVDQEAYHAQSHPRALVDQHRKATHEPGEMQRKERNETNTKGFSLIQDRRAYR